MKMNQKCLTMVSSLENNWKCARCQKGMGGKVRNDEDGSYFLCTRCVNEERLLWWAIFGTKIPLDEPMPVCGRLYPEDCYCHRDTTGTHTICSRVIYEMKRKFNF